MSYHDDMTPLERRHEEERIKKECEPYEEIIRRLRKRDQEKSKLERSPTDRKSYPFLFALQPRHYSEAGQKNGPAIPGSN